MDSREWAAALSADQVEQIFHAELGKGDIRGVEAALRLMAVKDPHRAQELMDLCRMALVVADARDRAS